MKDLLTLSAAEAEVVNRSLMPLLHPASGHAVLDLVRKWETFVEEVESGYQLTIYDYENDLGVRGVLKRLTDSLPRGVADRILAAVTPLDSRFDLATDAFPDGLSHGPATPDEWWYFRRPLRLNGELADDWKGR